MDEWTERPPSEERLPRVTAAWRRYRGSLERRPFMAAWQGVTAATMLVTVAGGLLVRVTDPASFDSLWDGMWWAAQTVTTVGYGDQLPSSPLGRIVAVAVMLIGVAFLTVTTAAIASLFAESSRRRWQRVRDDPLHGDLDRLNERLDELMAEVRALRERVGEREP